MSKSMAKELIKRFLIRGDEISARLICCEMNFSERIFSQLVNEVNSKKN